LIRTWKLVFIAPAIAIIALVLAPGQVQDRARSIVNPQDLGSRDRIVMWKIGRDMIRDHPVFGVGPEMIQPKYAAYRQAYPDAVNETNFHLHNVPIQIAAERGVPALILWAWFVGSAGWALWRQLRARVAPAIAAAGLAAVIAMLAAGLFEYNFGDSEFLMLFLGIITLPFAAVAERSVAASHRPQ
jgi:putative inorganic carbon (hco3(-)) transporter